MFGHSSVLHINARPVPCEVARARSFWARARGLLWRPALTQQQGLWIERCDSIHTVGMGYAIDAVFLDAQDHVLRVCENVPPWRFRLCAKAASVLELQAGRARVLGIAPGQLLGHG
ncbi:DUF192 domain-containing protein [Comamonas composti]|uniref:DUF192 domain-containing protein n=1 Tax=Comamonas composti TaxID=408558 RepID=UPI0004216F79|nr:DUF192 domain-containing protein [Comamonas composti]